MDNKQKEPVKVLTEKIEIWSKKRNKGQKNWSAAHYFVLFGSIVSSVSAGTLIQFEQFGLAAIFTTVAAVLTGIATSGGFERKWISNRLSRGRAECLLLELDNKDADINLVRDKFAAAIEKHDREIVGEKADEAEA